MFTVKKIRGFPQLKNKSAKLSHFQKILNDHGIFQVLRT